MSALSRLSLIQWLSPAFPTGGFAYSHGLEQAMTEATRDAQSVSSWVRDVLCHGGGWIDAVILALALRGEDPDELADLARAQAGSAERLTETMDQGRAFAETVAALSGEAHPTRPLPVAVGVAARGLGLPPDEVIGHYLHAFASNLVSAATRFLPLGQAQGQRALASLHDTIAETAARAAQADRDALATCCLGADLAAMRHETLYVRIFRT
ncbi:urease accessory UreF family protein [Paracoccus sp. MBLB3053]|uniref:Urease accessory protein UreF n=1 Tax=Paracoccus aurantius TaxID=3073814 RepID=A0ABU2HQB2_9RHOB|nr:urease accessory UreF family protein [Paracoccus sp. MBLB3053]MDS9467234.1 urease accessory UreF family protein [Paracoccus sp. MBLB3053]